MNSFDPGIIALNIIIYSNYQVFLPIPIVMVAVSIFLIVFPFLGEWLGCSVALAVLLCGIPVYLLFVHYNVLQYLPSGCRDSGCKFIKT